MLSAGGMLGDADSIRFHSFNLFINYANQNQFKNDLGNIMVDTYRCGYIGFPALVPTRTYPTHARRQARLFARG